MHLQDNETYELRFRPD